MSHRHLSLVVPPKRKSSVPSQFTGEFNTATRERFRQIRRELGLSLQQLGDFMQINWSTIRKWETGISRTCHSRHVSRVTNFLNHCYDEKLRGLNEPNCSLLTIMRQLPTRLRTEMEHAWTTYGVARCYPGESERLLRMLNSLVDSIAHDILNCCLNPQAKEIPSVSCIPLEVAETPSAEYHPER